MFCLGLDANRDATLYEKMELANKLGSTYIFVSNIDLVIAAEKNIFSLECVDGLKEESIKKMTFNNYKDLIEYVNDLYDYNKIENEFANMEGRVYRNRTDYQWGLLSKRLSEN